MKLQIESHELLCPACGKPLRRGEWKNSADDHKCGPKDWAARTNELLEALVEQMR